MSKKQKTSIGILFLIVLISGGTYYFFLQKSESGFIVGDLKVGLRSPGFDFTNNGLVRLTQWNDELNKTVETEILYPDLLPENSNFSFRFHNKDVAEYDSNSPTDAPRNKIKWDGASLEALCENDGFISMDSWGKISITSCIQKDNRVEISGTATCMYYFQYSGSDEDFDKLPQKYPFKVAYFKTPSDMWKGMTISLTECGSLNEKGDFSDDLRLFDAFLPTLEFAIVR